MSWRTIPRLKWRRQTPLTSSVSFLFLGQDQCQMQRRSPPLKGSLFAVLSSGRADCPSGAWFSTRSRVMRLMMVFSSRSSPVFSRNTRLANGSRSAWWAWYQRAPTSIWSHEFVAHRMIEADGRIEDHDDVKKMTADMLRLAEAIDKGLRSS